MGHPLILYDGVCGLCNRFVRFALRHDRKAMFRFASLQSRLAARLLAARDINPAALDTFYVLRNFNGENTSILPEAALLSRSDAVLFVLQELGGFWRAVAAALGFFPRSLREFGYRVVAHHRYRVFGRHAICPVPDPSVRSRFLDL